LFGSRPQSHMHCDQEFFPFFVRPIVRDADPCGREIGAGIDKHPAFKRGGQYRVCSQMPDYRSSKFLQIACHWPLRLDSVCCQQLGGATKTGHQNAFGFELSEADRRRTMESRMPPYWQVREHGRAIGHQKYTSGRSYWVARMRLGTRAFVSAASCPCCDVEAGTPACCGVDSVGIGAAVLLASSRRGNVIVRKKVADRPVLPAMMSVAAIQDHNDVQRSDLHSEHHPRTDN
jgi:hypothetical protein